VELHNYVPANSVNTKKENWKMLNQKVLIKLDIKLSSDTIHQLANGSQRAIEKLLTKLRMKVLSDGVEMHRLKLKVVDGNMIHLFNAQHDTFVQQCFGLECLYSILNLIFSIGKEIGDGSPDNNGYLKSPVEHLNKLDNEICEIKPSKFMYFKRGIFIVFSWIICFFHIWNCIFPRRLFHRREILNI